MLELKAMQDVLKVGVIGAGHMGVIHARCWTQLPGARVVAVADGQVDRAEQLTQRMNEPPRTFTSGEELIANGDVDVVSVCVPGRLHRSLVEAALRAHKHVLCEKPMALGLADCDAMIAAAGETEAAFTVGHVARFFPEYARAKALVGAGAVGIPAAVRTRRGGDFPRNLADWYADPAQSGGVVLDLLVHDLDWLHWCFGPVVRVYAKALTPELADRSLDPLDYALVTLRHASGVISHVEASWADPAGSATAFEIAGDGGLLTHDSRKTRTITRSLRAEDGKNAPDVVSQSPLLSGDDPYFRQIEHFARAIRTGQAPLVSPSDARTAVALALAAQESVRSGRAVSVAGR